MDYVTKELKVTSNAAYNLELGFIPDYVEVRNMTQWDQDSKKVFFYWSKNLRKQSDGSDISDGGYKGMENLATVATNGQKPIEGTSNGISTYDTSNFAARYFLIDTGATKITQATNALVTATGHGLTTGDKVTFQSITSGMTQINGLSSKVTVLGANTFTCDDINSTDFTAWDATLATGQFVKTSKLTQDTGFQGITLGTDIMVAADDYLLVTAWKSGNYANVTQA